MRRDFGRVVEEDGRIGMVRPRFFPEEYGGSGMNFRDLTVLLEEMGRTVLPSPFLSTLLLVGMPILAFGTKEQKDEILPKIARGDVVCTLAALEEDGDWWADSINVRADRGVTSMSLTAQSCLSPMQGRLIICSSRLAPNALKTRRKELPSSYWILRRYGEYYRPG